MSAPSVQSVSAGATAQTTSIVVPEPATTADGSLLLAYFTWYDNDAKVITPPSGGDWSLLMRGSNPGAGDDMTIALYWKIRGQGAGAVGGNYTFGATTTGSDFFSAPNMISVSGVNQTTPFPDSASFTKAFGNGTVSTGTGFTVTVNQSLAFFITSMDSGWDTNPISGWTNIIANVDGNQSVFTRVVTPAGSTGSPATTGNLDTWGAFMMAMAPPALLANGIFFGAGTTS
jgi:hypothetical protein